MLTISPIASSFGDRTRRPRWRRERNIVAECRENSMAVAEGQASESQAHETRADEKSWHEVVLRTLKRNDVRLVPYVPDRVLTTLIRSLHADPFFTTFATAREEEAVGIVAGAW